MGTVTNLRQNDPDHVIDTTVTDSVATQRRIARRKPFVGAYIALALFMVIYYGRPEDWIPGLSNVPLAKISGILAALALAFSLRDIRRHLSQEIIYLALLVAQLFFAAALSPVWRGGAVQTTLTFSKVLIIVIVMAAVINTTKRLRLLILIHAASVAMIAAVSIVKGRAVSGRLEGMLAGNYGNPNDLALATVTSLPLCLALLFLSKSRGWKAAWALAILVLTYVLFLTGSRAGLISLIVITAVCLWEFAVRGRRRYLLVVAVVAGIAFWVYAGKEVRLRWDASAQSTNADQTSAYASSQQRRELFIQSLKLTAKYPLFGVGPGNFEIISGDWHVSHNSYTQMSSEGGVLALVLYLMIFWRGFANLAATKRLSISAKERKILANSLRASLAAYLVGSFFASEAYQFFPYFFVAYTTVLYRISVREAIEKRDRDKDANGRKARETLGELPGTEAVCSGA